MEGKNGALSNIRILDLTRVLAGPFCTMILADMGADVIKIEKPGKGDDSRSYPPFIKGVSAYFMNLNRGKKSFTLNLKHPRGKEIFFKLVKISDVVVENFRPGVMESLGLDYDRLKEINPQIIYAAISGFGHSGPYRNRPGYDIIGQAMGGIMSVTGWPGGPPTRTGTAIADILAGLSAAIGILAALNARSITGKGQKLDVALVDSVVASMETLLQIYLVEKRVPQRIGNRYEFIYPYDTFKARNGWFVLGVGNDEIWKRLCALMRKEGYEADFTGFETNEARVHNYEYIREEIQKWVGSYEVNEIVELLMRNRIPAAPVYTVKEVAEDPHIAKAREMIVEINHPLLGKLYFTGSHIKLSGTPAMVRGLPPFLGEHNNLILTEYLGYSPADIDRLREGGVI
ncbi:MAG: CoA transferase [Synergistetes bacterium]|nr:CoA transferase [Synergistota bacterium]